MTLKAYINPDFTFGEKILFFLIGLVGVLLCTFGARLVTRLISGGQTKDKNELLKKADSNVELFYEMIISGSSVMSFAVSYVVCNHIYSLIQTSGESGAGWMLFYNIWSEGKDFALLLLICLSCVLNTILDKLIIPLKMIDRDKKATVRMLSMFYVIIILVYLNIIGDESEYSPVMMYYLGLMIGRFVYFDASFKDFVVALKNMFLNLHLLIMGIILTGVVCYIGFSAGYLLERNYYIVGIFYTHLFMLIAVFVLHHSYSIIKMIRKPATPKERYQEADYYGNQYDNGDQYSNGKQYDHVTSSNGYNKNANNFVYYNNADQDNNTYNGGMYYGAANTKMAKGPSQNTGAGNRTSQNMVVVTRGNTNKRPVNRVQNPKVAYNKAQSMKMPDKANGNMKNNLTANRNINTNRNTTNNTNKNNNTIRNTNKHISNNR